MQELISKNKAKLSRKVSQIDEAELAELLKEIGSYNIEHIPIDEIKKGLNTEYIGREIYSYHEVESTNNVAKFLARFGPFEGTIVISEIQTKGKGRGGKKWESPKGGIWLSIILKPEIDHLKAPLLTLATGIAIAKTIRRMNIDAKIKWPNDILINNKKVCGILTEASSKQNTFDYIIVGVGIDSNLNINNLEETLRKITTSLSNETQEEIKEPKIIANFLNEFEKIYNSFKEENFDEILNEWRRMSDTIGSYVKIKQAHIKVIEGLAVGINNQGELILKLDNGELKTILSGECSLKKH